jgi:hypothetical protein
MSRLSEAEREMVVRLIWFMHVYVFDANFIFFFANSLVLGYFRLSKQREMQIESEIEDRTLDLFNVPTSQFSVCFFCISPIPLALFC